MGADRRPRNKNLGGRPRAEIDYPKLEAMCALMCTGEECASVLGIDYDTLNNALARDGHVGFSDFLKKHSAKAKMSLRRAQFRAHTGWSGRSNQHERDAAMVAWQYRRMR